MKNGAPSERGDDADLELAGPGDDPAEDVARRAAGSAPSTIEYGSTQR